METIEHFAKISLVARLLGRENLIAREEVLRLQELRGTYGIKAPAPICPEPAAQDRGESRDGRPEDVATCQVVQAPLGGGVRLVPDLLVPCETPSGTPGGEEAEIRLTYRELSALIEEAIRSLR
jgi:L-fuculose-phosphate aldolase